MLKKLFSKEYQTMNSIWQDFKKSESSKQFPSCTLSMIAGASLIFAKTSIFKNPISFIKHGIFEDDIIDKLESQNNKKPTLIFDYRNFLYSDRFSMSRFDLISSKRYFCEEFLFNTAHYYELVCITSGLPTVSDKILSKIDPFGCIKYRIYLRDKKIFNKEHLNRDLSNTVVISTENNEFHNDFDKNTIKIPPFKKQNTKLTDMMHFLINVHYSNYKTDLRNIIQTYKDVDFFESFRNIQKKLFLQRNLLSFNRFEDKLDLINNEKIEEYKIFKSKIGNTNNKYNEYKQLFFRFVRNSIL